MKNDRIREIGASGEKVAGEYLKKKGYEILETNFHSRYGEIDIIAKDSQYIIFVEVKTRKKDSIVAPLEAVGHTKRKRLLKTAEDYLYKYPTELQPRFDVIAVTNTTENALIEHLENAFGMEG